MAFGFASVAHFFSSAAHTVSSVARAIAITTPKVAADVAKAEPTVEAISALILPSQVVELERGAFSLFGMAAQAIEDADAAALQKGVSISLDARAVADIKALLPAIEAFASKLGIHKPAAPAKI